MRKRGTSGLFTLGEYLPPFPEHLKKALHYVVVYAELSTAGVDARREDGTTALVIWRDIVGVVARRLPPELDGVSFVDIVSRPGATLRVLPWTRLEGETIYGDGDERLRGLLAIITSHASREIKLDPATQRFAQTTEPPAQLPDASTLATHDAKLA